MQVTHVESLFALKKKDAAPALKALKGLVAAAKKPERLVNDPAKVLAARELPAALEAAGFVVRVDAAQNLTGLRWGATPLPSDVKALREVLGTLAKGARDPGYLVVKADRRYDLLFRGKQLKVGYEHQAVALIEKIKGDADKAVDRKAWNTAVRLHRWLAEVEADAPEDDWVRRQYRAAWGNLPILLAEAGRLKELLELCNPHPFEKDALAGAISHLESELKRPKDAAWLRREQLKRNPNDALMLVDLLDQAHDAGDYPEVLKVAKRLASADAEWAPRALDRQLSALYALARYREALQLARQEGDDQLAGDIHEALGDLAQARSAWQRALDAHAPKLKEHPDSASQWGWHAQLLVRLGRLDDAQTTLAHALTLSESSHYVVQFPLGLLRLAQGDAAGAVAPLEAAVKSCPEYEHARYRLACALGRSGDVKRAKAMAKELAKRSKDVARRLKSEPWL